MLWEKQPNTNKVVSTIVEKGKFLVMRYRVCKLIRYSPGLMTKCSILPIIGRKELAGSISYESLSASLLGKNLN